MQDNLIPEERLLIKFLDELELEVVPMDTRFRLAFAMSDRAAANYCHHLLDTTEKLWARFELRCDVEQTGLEEDLAKRLIGESYARIKKIQDLDEN